VPRLPILGPGKRLRFRTTPLGSLHRFWMRRKVSYRRRRLMCESSPPFLPADRTNVGIYFQTLMGLPRSEIQIAGKQAAIAVLLPVNASSRLLSGTRSTRGNDFGPCCRIRSQARLPATSRFTQVHLFGLIIVLSGRTVRDRRNRPLNGLYEPMSIQPLNS
jgi:hypothetical protein